MTRRTEILRTVIAFVLHDDIRREVEKSADAIPYASFGVSVLVVPIPNAENVFIAPHAEDTPTDAIFVLELVSDDGDDQVLP